MRDGHIPVCVEAPTHPDDCFGIGTELRLGKADHCHPSMGKGIARRKAESLADVRFGLCASTKKNLCDPDESMSAGQIAIQRQCVLALSYALCPAFRKYLHDAQKHVGQSVVRRKG